MQELMRELEAFWGKAVRRQNAHLVLSDDDKASIISKVKYGSEMHGISYNHGGKWGTRACQKAPGEEYSTYTFEVFHPQNHEQDAVVEINFPGMDNVTVTYGVIRVSVRVPGNHFEGNFSR